MLSLLSRVIEREKDIRFALTLTASPLAEGIHDPLLNNRSLHLLNIAGLCKQLKELLKLEPVDVNPL